MRLTIGQRADDHDTVTVPDVPRNIDHRTLSGYCAHYPASNGHSLE